MVANAARLIYKSGLRKNEIKNIKIGDIQIQGEVVSEITPFLPETTRAYSKMPIIVNDESRKIIEEHIKKLTENGYHVDEDSHLFPDKKTKECYDNQKLKRHFNKHFGKMTFPKLRAYGFQRKKEHTSLRQIAALTMTDFAKNAQNPFYSPDGASFWVIFGSHFWAIFTHFGP